MGQRLWICKRQVDKIKCGHVNPRRLQLCEKCGKRRPATKKPAHMAVLSEVTYEQCVERWGEKCGICGVTRKPGARRLNRDHSHIDGTLRGLLCTRCNRALHSYMDLEWIENAAAYLRRATKDIDI